MKKTLLSLLALAAFGSIQAQNLLTENFDVIPLTWTQTNQSTTVGTNPLWINGSATVFNAYNGTPTAYAASNFNATTGAGTISNWLITPVVNLQNGDVITFYSRTVTDVVYADRLEMRISNNGAATVNPSGPTSVGDFTTLAVAINPDLDLTSYPNTWTLFSYTVSGLAAAVDSKVAFRYFVTSGGPTGNNSSYVGLDAVSIDRPTAGVSQFFKSNFAVSPNPANNFLNISAKANVGMNQIQITDLNGRVVKTINANGVSQTQIDIAELTSGMYFVKIQSDLGTGTTKIMKN